MKNLLSIFALSGLLFLVSCKGKDGEIGPMGAAGTPGQNGVPGPSLKGNIVGFVSLFDEIGTRYATSDGTTVTVEGSNPEIKATSNVDGKYELKDVPTGTYNLSFTRTGFGNFKRPSIVHIGGTAPTNLGNNNLWETAKTTVTNIAVKIDGTNIILSGKATPVMPTGSSTTVQRRVRFFFGKDDKVSYLNYFDTFNQLLVPPGGDGTFSFTLTNANISKFKTGDKVFIICYGLSPLENAYTDPATNYVVYSGVNLAASNVVSAVLQ